MRTLNQIKINTDIVSLDKLTIEQLKETFKTHGLPTRGLSSKKKQEIKDILQNFLNQKNAIRTIRYYYVKYYTECCARRCHILRGDLFERRDQCVNDTDFYTLEPIHNIPKEQFYGFSDSKGFFYGFNIFSLKSLLAIHPYGQFINPYTRERISDTTKQNIQHLIHMMEKSEPHIRDMNKEPIAGFHKETVAPPVSSDRFMGNSLYPPRQQLSDSQIQMVEKMIDIRSKSVEIRIREVFCAIDLLGYYTEANWFRRLTTRQHTKFIYHFHRFWNIQSHLSPTVKAQICSITSDPFYNLMINNLNIIQPAQVQETSLIVLENVIYTGVNESSRQTGALQALEYLADASDEIRRGLPWLQ